MTGEGLRRLCRLSFQLVSAPLLAALVACTQRQPAAPPTAQAPASAPASAASAPASAASAPGEVLADPERDQVLFSIWRGRHTDEVEAFEAFLVQQQVAQVVPTYQLLRSASMWKECHAEPFELPPAQEWSRVRDLLVLLRELKTRQVLPQFEVVSAYRDPRLNRCAGGAPGSAHQAFAVDIAPLPVAEGEALCRFWREQGKEWDMGVSRYPSGRIHIDRTGYRTWGATHRRGSSFCLD
jgi:hypothetical protein